RLPGCNLVLADAPGVDWLRSAGILRSRTTTLTGCQRVFAEGPWPEHGRDIDILFVGNLNPAVQGQRAAWLARLARLGERRRVLVDAGRARAAEHTFEALWDRATEQIEEDWPTITERCRQRAGAAPESDLLARSCQSLSSTRNSDLTLSRDLHEAVRRDRRA